MPIATPVWWSGIDRARAALLQGGPGVFSALMKAERGGFSGIAPTASCAICAIGSAWRA